MNKEITATLTVSNNMGFLQLIRTFIREISAVAELEEDRTEALILAADEACTNIIKHAFEPGESGSVDIEGSVSPSELTVAIRDQGLPFDPSSIPDYTPPSTGDVQQASARGLGFYLIRQAVDEARWIHHGKEGKELRLVVHLEEPDVTQQLPAQELTPFDEETPRAREQNYDVRRLRPEEAIYVSQCIYRAYGYTYPIEDLYYPDRIVRMNETGELLSAVAVAEDGEIVGHYALERPDLGIVAESGQAVVRPAHRGRKLMERMRAFLTEEGEKLGLQGFYSQPVTSHIFSQRVNERFGSRVAGITLGLVPRELRFKRIKSEPLPQRETVMLYFRNLGQPLQTTVYAPNHHKTMIERLYNNLDRPVIFKNGESLYGRSNVSVLFHKGLEAGFIRFPRVGIDSPTELSRTLNDLCALAEAEVIILELPLAQSGTPELCAVAEKSGFFFSGIGPCFAPDGDVLRMQYLNTDFDMSRLQLYSPFAKELAEYIATERDRVS